MDVSGAFRGDVDMERVNRSAATSQDGDGDSITSSKAKRARESSPSNSEGRHIHQNNSHNSTSNQHHQQQRNTSHTNNASSKASKAALESAKQNVLAEYQQWKRHVPILYDCFWSHHLVWPSLCVRWGPILDSQHYAQRHRIYYTERGGPQTMLIVASAEVYKKRVCTPDSMTQVTDDRPSRHCVVQRKIPIPDNQEANRLMESRHHAGILCAKTDAASLFAWHMPDLDRDTVVPAFKLSGHSESANESSFAVATSNISASILSGGKDSVILQWNFEDAASGIASSSAKAAVDLSPRQSFKGHVGAVEDVVFRPNSGNEFGTVSDDRMLCLWDDRAGSKATQAVTDVAPSDLSCLDWNHTQDNHLVVGASDGACRLFDLRKLGAGNATPVFVFSGGHSSPVYRIEWSRHSTSHFASAGEDRYLLVWDVNKMGGPRDAYGTPAEVILKHAGHRNSIADFQWNPDDEWTFVTVSEDTDVGGGTMQVWRMSDLIYRSDEEVLEELSRYHTLLDAN